MRRLVLFCFLVLTGAKRPTWKQEFTEEENNLFTSLANDWMEVRKLLGINRHNHKPSDLDLRELKAFFSGNTKLLNESYDPRQREYKEGHTMVGGFIANMNCDECHRRCHHAPKDDPFYIRIYKNANDQICQTLKYVNITPKPTNFTVSREPLSRFVSSYAEIEYRDRQNPKDPIDQLKYKTFHHPILRASAFIRDMVLCRMRHFYENLSTHAFTQLSFLYKAHISNFYRMEDLPKMNVTHMVRRHIYTDTESGNIHRTAMETVISEPRYRCAVVQMYALDYVCFHYEVPKPCIIRQNLTCPYNILHFSAFNPLNYGKL
eukprot:m.287983 g.287983  ORF g.287983 m.287983 type:complete len:319 (-) comp16369_c0_seq1:1968-2924(-)